MVIPPPNIAALPTSPVTTVVAVVLCVVFKQKTAYEIKECDWSSDVCSSDLGRCSHGNSFYPLGLRNWRARKRLASPLCTQWWMPPLHKTEHQWNRRTNVALHAGHTQSLKPSHPS